MLGEDKRTFVILALLLTFFCHRTSSVCVQSTPCSCMFSNGQGFNLTALGNSRPLEVFDKNYILYFHPCTNTPLSNITHSDCYKREGVSLCLLRNNTAITLGKVEETKIGVQSDNQKPFLTIQHGNYSTTISLNCYEMGKTHLVVESIVDRNYSLLLTSPYACIVQLRTVGLSTGSILVICFIVLTAVYFIGGALVLKTMRGATGWEMIPNHKFWRDLPALIRDGVTFTTTFYRADSYEPI
ncbi:uncharacterized protein LOC143146854 [Ptiloglossa arizonensis]|uniref:uncharacterized protein LOC143146854 n=1 Tax=Ptiloglossa arizonensis TaxID=3350558 RepID=UPI003FA00D31